MTIPHWVPVVEPGFDVTSPAITVYRSCILWVRTTLWNGQADILMKGMKGCWPSLDSSTHIRELAVSLHIAILPEMPMVGVATKTLLKRISQKVNPDKNRVQDRGYSKLC